MRRTLSLLLALSATACVARQQQQTQKLDARTIENVPISSIPVQPLPTVNEDVSPVLPKNAPQSEIDRLAALGQRVELPFAPAIAMDPVDGSKVSIRANTPTYEYNKHVYYFSSNENRQQFISNAEQYTKGALSKYQ